MAVRVVQVIVPLARGRELIDALYGKLLSVAARTGSVPCALLEGYAAVRERQLRAETLLRDAARAQGFHPPEDVPRSFAIFGACTPGTSTLKLEPAMLKAGQEYLAEVAKRRQGVDGLLAKAYKDTPDFRPTVDAHLAALARFARANTAEALPPPRNIGLLKLFYFIGGSPWHVMEAEEFRQGGNIEGLEGMEVVKILSDATALEKLADELLAAAPPAKGRKPALGAPPKSGAPASGGMPWWGVGLGVLGVAGVAFGGYKLYTRRRDRALLVEAGFDDLPRRRRLR